MKRPALIWIAAAVLMGAAAVAHAEGDAEVGARAFNGACAACHTLAPGRHMTGPSLAGLWNRESGAVADFPRYSPALKSAGIIWEDSTLDPWLADPKAFLPGNWMTFPGLKDPEARADLIAFLKRGGQGAASGGGNMMMGPPRLRDLKELDPDQRVTAIRRCGDSYHVTTAAGPLPPFWEPNLRFKTDASETGPRKGQPAIVPAGMLGDRAFVIFAEPAEISAAIEDRC